MQPSFAQELKRQLLTLQLLIARAAQKDSLNWWEDDSLTPAGLYLLEKLFLFAPTQTGRKLALRAARNRYRAAFAGVESAYHLFNLDKSEEVDVHKQQVPIFGVDVPVDPIVSLDALRHLLVEQTGAVTQYEVIGVRAEHRLEIRPKVKPAQDSPLQLAQTLAWATLEGEPGKPVFPYISDR